MHEGMAVGLSAGTTTWALAKELVNGPRITVVTNSVRIADLFHHAASGGSARYGSTVILIGGERTPSDALVGPIATAALKQLHLDVLFLGVHGMDADAGFTTPNLLEAETDRAFVAAARKTVVLADHTKWGLLGISTIAALDEADEVISDAGLGAEAQRILGERVGKSGSRASEPAALGSRAAAGLPDVQLGGEDPVLRRGSRRAPTSALTAASAIAWTGCSTVVSGGQLYSASAEPSKEASAMSPGTDRPASWSARRMPIACMSELAKIAVGRFAEASSRLPGGVAAGPGEGAAHDRALPAGPPPARACSQPCFTAVQSLPALVPMARPMLVCPWPIRCSTADPCAGRQVHADAVEARRLPLVVQQHRRDVGRLQVRQVRFEQHAGQQHPVHLPRRQVADVPALLGEVPVGVGQQQGVAQLGRGILHGVGQQREERVAVVRDDQPDASRWTPASGPAPQRWGGSPGRRMASWTFASVAGATFLGPPLTT